MTELNLATACRFLLPAMALCAACTALAQSPPFSEDLVLWFDGANPADIQTDAGNRILRWDNRAEPATTLALFPAPGLSGPAYQQATDAFGPAAWFDGESVLELKEETSPGVWEAASFTTTDGLGVFVVSRGPSVSAGNNVSWQATLGWTQSGSWRQGLTRAYSHDDGQPEPYPEGDCHLYFGHGSPVPISQVQMGSKISSTGAYVNRLNEVEVAEVLFYQRGFEEAERVQIMTWLHQRHGLSTDLTNPTAGRDPRRTPLKNYVPEGSGFQIAAAANTNFFRVDQNISTNYNLARYACTESSLERHYQLLTPTNDFKMSRVAPDFTDSDLLVPHDWTVTDSYVEWAQARGIDWHGHVLIWHRGIPGSLANNTWLGGSWTEAQLRALFTDHISEMVSRYTPEGARPDLAGTVKIWDVVNEAIVPAWNYVPDPNNPSDWQDTLRSTIWFDGNDGAGGRPGLGPGFIAEAFHLAEAASGSDDIVLLYNDFSADEVNTKSDAIYKMCVDLLDQGVPIDGVGLQMHINIYGLNLDSFKANIQRFRALRNGSFEVHITELDIGIPGLVTREKLERQGRLYYDIVTAALEAGANSVHTWGIHDIWTSVPRGYSASLPFSKVTRLCPEAPYPGPLPMDHPARRLSFLEPKPAFYGIRDALADFFGTGAKRLPLSGFSAAWDQSLDFQVTLPASGIVDIMGADAPGTPAMLLGTEGDWRSFEVMGPGSGSFQVTDPDWTGDRRFWEIHFSPRP